MLIIKQALICDALSHLSSAMVRRVACCRIYHSPTTPQLIRWWLSPGVWNVNKTQPERDVHCSS
ncbi:hypothetical protein N308_07843 [Struthio camelus australis]|uniref:Uncharacterized protein n=1 Tax=Struthio camelus australis TaxID=441894 RepID=A0A093HMU9_STRCA|nr:hypothetical protein N308_07843 [Struthio camelus australis]